MTIERLDLSPACGHTAPESILADASQPGLNAPPVGFCVRTRRPGKPLLSCPAPS